MRMCIDYRVAFNQITLKSSYPMPQMDDLFDQIYGSNYFSNIYLKSGYHHVNIRDKGAVKSTSKTRFGHLEFLAMPFGLANTLVTFMMIMDNILRPYLENVVVIFLNNILV